MNKKLLMLLLTLGFITGASINVSADTKTEPQFADMPNNWSTTALKNAVKNGILSGYPQNPQNSQRSIKSNAPQNGQRLIKPNAHMTRAEMAAVLNNAFKVKNQADMTGVTDVPPGQWYTVHMAKSVKMGLFEKASRMRPDEAITREEAFTVLAKAFHVSTTPGDYGQLNNLFSDVHKISAYAKEPINAMLNRGFIRGSGDKLNPKGLITRAEFAAVMDNIVHQYVTEAGEVTESKIKKGHYGYMLVNTAGVTLKDIYIDGNLILTDGINAGEVVLENVEVPYVTLIRNGGDSKVRVTGNSCISNMKVSASNGNANIYKEGDATVNILRANGKVTLYGEFGRMGPHGVIERINLESPETVLTVPRGTWIMRVFSFAPRTVIQGEGTVKYATISGDDSQINTNETAVSLDLSPSHWPKGVTAGYDEVDVYHFTSPTTSSQTNPVALKLSLSEGVSAPLVVATRKGYAVSSGDYLREPLREGETTMTITVEKGSMNHKRLKLAFVLVNEFNHGDLQLIDGTRGQEESMYLSENGWFDSWKIPRISLEETPTVTRDLAVVATKPGTYKFKVQLINLLNNNKVIAESDVCTVVAE